MKEIFILDDHKLFSGGLELLLKSLPMPTRCYRFEDVGHILDAVGESDTEPALFIIDFYIPGCNVPDLISRLIEENPERRILVVSASINISDRNLALDSGATCFLNKDTDPQILLETVTTLISGSVPDQQIVSGDDLAEKFGLTPRQLEILVLVSKGLSNKEIARALSISPETVKSHLKEIFLRFEVSNKLEAVDFARSNGLS